MSDKYRYTARLIRKVDIEVECEYDSDYDTVTIVRAYDPITEEPVDLEDEEINYCTGEACDEWLDALRADAADHRIKAQKENQRGD